MTRRFLLIAALISLLVAAPGCVYRVDVQQGNLLEQKDIDAVEVGMTRSQVRFLLGTPVIQDPYDADRWDYVYYFRKGRRVNADQRWLIVWFENDRVSKFDKDVPIDTS